MRRNHICLTSVFQIFLHSGIFKDGDNVSGDIDGIQSVFQFKETIKQSCISLKPHLAPHTVPEEQTGRRNKNEFTGVSRETLKDLRNPK